MFFLHFSHILIFFYFLHRKCHFSATTVVSTVFLCHQLDLHDDSIFIFSTLKLVFRWHLANDTSIISNHWKNWKRKGCKKIENSKQGTNTKTSSKSTFQDETLGGEKNSRTLSLSDSSKIYTFTLKLIKQRFFFKYTFFYYSKKKKVLKVLKNVKDTKYQTSANPTRIFRTTRHSHNRKWVTKMSHLE